MNTLFLQQILRDKLLMIDKKVIPMVSPNENNNRLPPKICYEIIVKILWTLLQKDSHIILQTHFFVTHHNTKNTQFQRQSSKEKVNDKFCVYLEIAYFAKIENF